MFSKYLLLLALIFPEIWTIPLNHEPDHLSSQLGSRLGHTGLLQDALERGADPRLPIPTPQDLEAIRKIVQVLVMLGEQVIPSLLGDTTTPSVGGGGGATMNRPVDVPNDPVNN